MSLPRNNRKLRACAECRRLKLRCDRNFPCQACVRRGCSSICPDKCFTEKSTPSSLKANTLRSREKIESLEARVAALENALAQDHPSHPLLSAGCPSPLESTGESDALLEEAAELLGTLTIAEDGSTVFNGPARCSKPMQSSSSFPDPRVLSGRDQPDLPDNIQLLSALFPFTPHSVATAASINDFLPFLPVSEVVLELIARYWYTFIAHSPISRDQFVKQVYEAFYPDQEPRRHLVREDSHRLGLLFMTMALHVLINTDNSMLSLEAETYHQLARAALSLDPVCENTTIAALQCMLSMSWYIRMAPVRASSGYDWAFNGITVKLASSIGIFRDSRKWISDPDEITQREMLCWEIICMEQWMAFFNGRPSSIDLSLVDCQRPTDATIGSPSLPIFFPGYHTWKYSFYSMINNVLLVAMRPKPVKYSEILALERQLRECVMPPDLEVPLHGSPLQDLPDDAIVLHFQRFTALLIKETTVCVLHRRFLVLALEKGSEKIQDTPFRYSVLRAGHSSRWIVTSLIIMYRRHPKLISRAPAYWSAGFSAAIILGAIAARYSDRDFAQCVLAPFESIHALFVETAGLSIQPPHALESLQRLHKRVKAQFPADSISNNSSPLNDQHLCMDPQVPTPISSKPRGVITAVVSRSPSEVSTTDSLFLGKFPGSVGAPITGISVAGSDVSDPPTAPWPVFDFTQPLDDPRIHVDLHKGNELQQSLPGVIGVTSLRSPTAGEPVAEVGQWDHFLDNLGVWD